MDKERIIYFEIDDAAEDENGEPAPAGARVKFGECPIETDYDTICEETDLEAVAKFFHLDPEKCHYITPKEYADKYGDDDD